MNLSKTTYLLLLAILLGQAGVAQKSKIRQGDKHFEDLAYAKAIEDYQLAYESGGDASQFSTKMAKSYHEIRDFDNAVKWYAEAIKTDKSAENLLGYSEALKAIGRYAESKMVAEEYLAKKTDDRRAKMYVNSGNYVTDLKANPERYSLQNLSVNSPQSDFGTAWMGKDVVFASARKMGVATKRKHQWNDAPFLDLYSAEVAEDATLLAVKELPGEVNSKFHEGPCAFTPDLQTVYFSRNNFYEGKKGKDTEDVVRLKIYSAGMEDGAWTEIIPFPYNSDSYSVSHPTLSKDGLTMYFASDMPGGYGGVDIWKSQLNAGSWSTPMNAGPEINTEGDEMFPFFHNDETLYFSSTGHPGLGGLDVMMASLSSSGFSAVENMGFPMNTKADDFGFILNPKGNSGYVSSNREGGKGDDDIYKFTMKPIDKVFLAGKVINGIDQQPLEKAQVRLISSDGEVIEQFETAEGGDFKFELPKDECNFRVEVNYGDGWSEYDSPNTPCDKKSGTIDLGEIPLEKHEWAARGTVRDRATLSPVGGFLVTLTDKNSGEKFESTTSDDGGVLFALAKDTDYDILFEKDGYFSKSGSFSTAGMQPGILDINKYVDLTFDKIVIGKGIKIENIYYDYNKFFIRPDAAVELDKIVKLLEDNPSIKIEMGSHTDARGTDSYNAKLSKNRAKAAMEYIISRGVDKRRLTYKGYGETVLVNRCKNNVNCTDQEHEENRRTEFKVLGTIDDER